jgi:hypothetical protein
MEKIKRLEIMYEHARKIGACANRKTFAALLGTTDGVVSRFFSGGRVLTDKFLLRVNEALDNAFSTEWVLYGTGEMYSADNAGKTDTTPLSSTPVTEDSSDVDYRMRCAELERVIEALKGTIESQKGTIKSQERIIEMLERENESIKKARTHVS